MDYLRAKILWDHLESLSIDSGDTHQGATETIADGTTHASTLSLLDCSEQDVSVGGLGSNDVARYGPRRPKFTQAKTEALAASLDNTLNDIALYYHATEELDATELHSLARRLDEDVKTDLLREESSVTELVSQLETVLSLYQDAAEVHARLQASLEDAIRKLPPILNANHTASNDLLALTIETSLLKLSVVRARMRSSLYGYTSSSNPSASMARAVSNLHERLTVQEHNLETQQRDLETRLQGYQQLLELVDGQDGGFAQVVEDLATVRRDTEDCRRDLRRLGWTEK